MEHNTRLFLFGHMSLAREREREREIARDLVLTLGERLLELWRVEEHRRKILTKRFDRLKVLLESGALESCGNSLRPGTLD